MVDQSHSRAQEDLLRVISKIDKLSTREQQHKPDTWSGCGELLRAVARYCNALGNLPELSELTGNPRYLPIGHHETIRSAEDPELATRANVHSAATAID